MKSRGSQLPNTGTAVAATKTRSAEVLLCLDFLPRDTFMGAVLRQAHGADLVTRGAANDAESATVSFLPGTTKIRPAGPGVQPDAWIATDSHLILVEAKAIRSGQFQLNQLAREYVVLVQESGPKVPLLLLILGNAPPVKVEKVPGLIAPRESIRQQLPEAAKHAIELGATVTELSSQIDDRLAWITWSEIAEVVGDAVTAYSGSSSTDKTVQRLAATLIRAVDWHASA
jgi:hypothetical protein